MKFVLNAYKFAFIKRFDLNDAIPYLSSEDFPNLICNKSDFINRSNITISCFEYYYDDWKDKKIILFLPGIGPGHRPYLREIESFALQGYKIVTLDYAGTGASSGDKLYSINNPTNDVLDLLKHLNLTQEIVLIGHSLGGYTALNIMNILRLKRCVIISGFVDLYSLMIDYLHSKLLLKEIYNYEKEMNPFLYNLNNWDYLQIAEEKILWIQSKDDDIVSFKNNLRKVERLNNPNIEIIVTDKKRHNPTYTIEAVKFMNESISGYYSFINKNKNMTSEERKKYFNGKSVWDMTTQDENIANAILKFIK